MIFEFVWKIISKDIISTLCPGKKLSDIGMGSFFLGHSVYRPGPRIKETSLVNDVDQNPLMAYICSVNRSVGYHCLKFRCRQLADPTKFVSWSPIETNYFGVINQSYLLLVLFLQAD